MCKICGNKFLVPSYRKNTVKYCSKECRNKSLYGNNNCKCLVCEKQFHLKPFSIKPNGNCCSRECLAKYKRETMSGSNNHQYGLKGDKNASFKGDKICRKNVNLTDVLLYKPQHPSCDASGRVLEHRYKVEINKTLFDDKYFELKNGVYVLKRGIEVHHINHDHNDNRIENLIPFTKSEHRSVHNLNIVFVRDIKTGRITGVFKQGELLEKPEEVDQQPSLNSNILEGSTTNSRIQTDNAADSNANTSALPVIVYGDDIV